MSRARFSVHTLAAATGAALLGLSLHAQVPGTYTFTTIGAATAGSTARFRQPTGLAIDASDTIYVADTYNHTIRKITAAGVVTTLAGGAGSVGTTDGTGTAARFNAPRALTVDAAGNIFVVDTSNHAIRKITPAGVVTTYAGTPGTAGSAEGAVGVGQLSSPWGIAVNASGVVFVADRGNHVIRMVTTVGVLTNLAGLAGSEGGTDGTGTAARFRFPKALVLDGNGDLLVTESGGPIRKITTAGVVTSLPFSSGLTSGGGLAVRSDGTLVASDSADHSMVSVGPDGTATAFAGWSGVLGSSDGLGPSAQFYEPNGVVLDSLGNAYVADYLNYTIRKITPSGWVTTLAGRAGVHGTEDGVISAGPVGLAVDGSSIVYVAHPSGQVIGKLLPSVLPEAMSAFAGVGSAGAADGTTSAVGLARFNNPMGVAVDSTGAIFALDKNNHTIRKITAGVVSTFAGMAGSAGVADGTGAAARFNAPWAITIDTADNLYVTDRGNCTVRRITPAAVVTTVAGEALACASVDGTASAARFSTNLTGITADGTGTLYVTDDATIRAIAPGAVVTTLAGVAGARDHVDGTGSAARFRNANAIAFGAGQLALTDGNTIRTVTLSGVVATLAGDSSTSPSGFGSVDGTGSAARFFGPLGIAVDASGLIWVADSVNHKIRTVTSAGVVTSVAGGPGAGSNGSLDGTGNAARFFAPAGIAFGSGGILYVADTSNHTVRAISPALAVTTVAGVPLDDGATDGAATFASFSQPAGVAPSAAITYVADTGNHSIRRIASGQVTTLAGSPGTSGSANGNGAAARFNQPAAIGVGTAGIFVADSGNNLIRIVTTAGDVETFASGLSNPMGIAVHTDGSVYVADTGNHVIRRITSGGAMTTLAGDAGVAGAADGTGTGARFSSPRGVAVGSDGTVFVADAGNHAIRAITSSGAVTTIGGAAGSAGLVDGAGTAARFFEPTGIAVDATGTLYVADFGNGVVRQGVTGTQTAPVITTQPVAQGAASGQPVQFTVAATGHPLPIYRWKRGSQYLRDDATYSGVNTPVLTVVAASSLTTIPYSVEVSNAAGSATSTSASLVVYSITAAPTGLRFAGRHPGGSGAAVPSSVTPPQVVQVMYNGPGQQPVLTAVASQPWLTITGGSGTGDGTFTVGITSGATFAPEITSASITISAPNLGMTTQLDVILVISAQANTSPVGQVDTPVQNAEGVVGAIGVTGWAVDDVAVSHVKVYRNCLPFDNPLSCQLLHAYNMVYIGDAPFLTGARPDVEAAFSGAYPQAQSAGFGMQVLSPMLPRTTGATALYGGQGPITLYVVATDVEGQSRLLGRNWFNNQTPTSLTLANDSIAKPFGTVDTPSHGGTVSGTIISYGWALTPDSNTTVDGTDIIVPTDGSTARVFIDGVLSGTVTYDQCRGNVGNPVPAGIYCDDDIASVFGNTTPQAPLNADRTSNPTRYRNLDAARGAIGAFSIDTTTLANGMHTLDWSVTDSANRIDGIGSRFFTVLNGGVRAATVDELRATPGVVRARASVVADLAPAAGDLWGRSGFDLSALYQKIAAGDDGTRAVRIPEMNRLELWLGAGITAGYLEANDTLRDLPPGSRLDPETGIFTWAPGPGYVGTYRLVFVGAGAQGQETTPVSVTIWPTTIPAPGYSEIRMGLEGVEGPVLSERSLRVEGWARDPQAFTGHGIGAVHVWAKRTSGPGGLVPGGALPVFLGSAELTAEGAFRLPSTAGLPPGEYAVTAYAWALRTGRWEDARTVTIVVR